MSDVRSLEGAMGADTASLIEALERCGLARVGQGRTYVRLRWPNMERTLTIPLDPDIPEYPELMDGVRRELAAYARQGDIARAILAVLDDAEGVSQAEAEHRRPWCDGIRIGTTARCGATHPHAPHDEGQHPAWFDHD